MSDSESDNENLKLWRRDEKPDPRHTKRVNSRGGFTAIDAQWQVFVATKLWGPMGSAWGVRGIEYGMTLDGAGNPLEIWAQGELFYPDGVIEIASDMGYRPGNDSRKKLRTDMMTKGLSQLGFSADVFMGLFDDSKYRDALDREVISEEWEEDRVEFCSTLDDLGFCYKDVCLWQESRGKPRPSAMERSEREKLLDWVSSKDNRDRLRHDIEALHIDMEEM